MTPSSRRQRIARRLLAISAAAAATGAQCEPGRVTVTSRPPDPVLVDASGEPNADGFDALVASVESERGVGFVQRPSLELARADDPRLASFLAASRALEPCPRSEAASAATEDAAGRCFPDPGLAWIVCVAPPDLGEARRALRGTLDAQNHPRLARVAAAARGDAGVALRSLLAASANGAPPRGAPPPDRDAEDLFDRVSLEVEAQDVPAEACEAIAAHFLLATSRDPDAAFRRPPLSTMELFSPKRWEAGVRAERLAGAPPRVDGCRVASDESVGVARLVVEASARGGAVPAFALAGWRGDRGVRLACDDGAALWIYAAELSDPAHASAFAQSVARLLPADFAGPSEARAVGRHAIVASRGLAAGSAIAWANALVPVPLISLRDALE